MEKIDPILLGVLVNGLQSITEEMNVYLVKSAYSTNIKVRRDCSCAIYDKNGEMLAQGEFIPVHLGVMSTTLKNIIRGHLIEIDNLKPGDTIIHNDPYIGGSHLWDVILFKPIFYEEDLIGFVGNLAHHVDMGGSPGICSVPTIFEEGLRIPPLKIMKEGKINEDILKLITTNVRTAYEVKGDIMAQIAANSRGEKRIKELVEKYGVETLLKYFEEILNYSERGMRSSIKNCPDGKATFEDYIENDGIEEKLIKIKVKVTVKGSDVYLDFKGSGKPGRGGVNSPWSLTLSASYYAIKAIMGPQVPTNSGVYRPIHVLKPSEESILDAQYPHAVSGCTCTPAQRIVDVIIGAFSKIVPERVCAADGDLQGIGFIGFDHRVGRYFAYLETYACGRGAKYDEDGADAHQTHITNTRNASTEIIELEHPLRVDKYALIPDSGGAGMFRGGVGITREITCLTTCGVSILPTRLQINPYGLFGGEGGATASCGIQLSTGEVVINSRSAESGTKTFIRTAGGGGWGDPLERDIKRVEWDALNGYINLEAALDVYGCVIDPKTYKADREKTKELRDKLKKKNKK